MYFYKTFWFCFWCFKVFQDFKDFRGFLRMLKGANKEFLFNVSAQRKTYLSWQILKTHIYPLLNRLSADKISISGLQFCSPKTKRSKILILQINQFKNYRNECKYFRNIFWDFVLCEDREWQRKLSFIGLWNTKALFYLSQQTLIYYFMLHAKNSKWGV